MKAIDLLDTDKCEIGFPVIDFLTNWVSTFNNKEEFPEEVCQAFIQITDLVFKRLAFPEWIEINIEPDDEQVEYMTYRKLLKMIFLHLSIIPGYKETFFIKFL